MYTVYVLQWKYIKFKVNSMRWTDCEIDLRSRYEWSLSMFALVNDFLYVQFIEVIASHFKVVLYKIDVCLVGQ